MNESNMSFFKQEMLFNPDTEDKRPVIIYGAGSIGSHTAVALAKTGFKDITVYDYDEVEPGNVPAQMFRIEDADNKKKKTDALKEIVRSFTGLELNTRFMKIEEDFMPNVAIGVVHVLALDNIETRKLIYQRLVGFPVYLIDGRIGSFNYELWNVKMNGDKRFIDAYEQSLEGEFVELVCGEKCLYPVNSMLAAMITESCIMINKDRRPLVYQRGRLMSDIKIVKKDG